MDTEVEIKEKLDIFIPKDVMSTIHTKIFKELLMGILVFIYYILIDLLFLKGNENVFIKSLNIATVFFTILAIVLFEIGYRKKEDNIFIRGIEISALALITLFMPYVYLKRGKTFISLYSLSCLYISVYYAIKALIIYVNEVRKYRQGLSDIKEILTFHKESYLNERNERKFENIDDENLNKKHRFGAVRITLDKIKEKKRKTRTKISKMEEIKKVSIEKDIKPKMKIDLEKDVKPKKKINLEKDVKPKKKINLVKDVKPPKEIDIDDDIEIKKSKKAESKIKDKTPKKRGRKPTSKKTVKSIATTKTKNEEDK